MKEKYELKWIGKSKCKTLITDKLKSKLIEHKNFNLQNKKSKNLLIKGDNLEGLKHLSINYNNKIKMIYIDPPYNTGNNFIYQDKCSHSNWLSFMYPRLYIARQLLKNDGVIFISIDDNEIAQLKLLMNEIFGEENFVGQWNWCKTLTPSNLSKKIKKNIEYILVYEKKLNKNKYIGENTHSNSYDPLTKQQNNHKILTFPASTINIKNDCTQIVAGTYGTNKYPNKLLNNLIVKNQKNQNEVKFQNKFTWTQKKLELELKKNTKINLSPNGILSYKKSKYGNSAPQSFISAKKVGTTEQAGQELFKLFNKKIFDYPKPVKLIKHLINFVVKENDIILDFFAGSATTAQAVLELNKEDNKNRQFILIQIAQPIEKNNDAYDYIKKELKIKNPTIFDITKERIIKSANKIKIESENKINIKRKSIKNIEQQLDFDNKQKQLNNTKNEIKKLINQDLGFQIFEII